MLKFFCAVVMVCSVYACGSKAPVVVDAGVRAPASNPVPVVQSQAPVVTPEAPTVAPLASSTAPSVAVSQPVVVPTMPATGSVSK